MGHHGLNGSRRGFTLIELMIAATIIAVLAMIAFPKFANLIRKSQEASIKGTLGALRGALRIMYVDSEGVFPWFNSWGDGVGTAAYQLVPKYLVSMPYSITLPGTGHGEVKMQGWGGPGGVMGVGGFSSGWIVPPAPPWNVSDLGSYAYYRSYRLNPEIYIGVAEFRIACTHPDVNGVIWSTY
jgi:prepilin-type N-terminal cleavage/methylation domain-containing protein